MTRGIMDGSATLYKGLLEEERAKNKRLLELQDMVAHVLTEHVTPVGLITSDGVEHLHSALSESYQF
jgi:hypothetical protein